MNISTNSEALCIKEIGQQEYQDIFLSPPIADFMAVGVPVIAGLGICGNMLVIWANQHRKLTGLSILLLNTLVMSDTLLLITAILMYLPRGHLAGNFNVHDCASRNLKFWKSLDYAQRMYVVVHPVLDTAQCFTVWYGLAYTLELYGTFFHPSRIAKLSKHKSTGIKILVTVFNIIIILSLIHFFKFVRRDSLYHSIEHKKICFSDIYTNSVYTNYDDYIYYGILIVAPWFMILYALIRISVEIYQRNRDPLWLSHADMEIVILLKEGRSRCTVITLSIVFLLFHGVVDVINVMLAAKVKGQESLSCYLVPMDRRYATVKNGHTLEVVNIVLLIIHSSIKFPICFITGKKFRVVCFKTVWRCCWGMSQCCIMFRLGFRPIKIPIDQPSGTMVGKYDEQKPTEMPLKLAIELHSHQQNQRTNAGLVGQYNGKSTEKNFQVKYPPKRRETPEPVKYPSDRMHTYSSSSNHSSGIPSYLRNDDNRTTMSPGESSVIVSRDGNSGSNHSRPSSICTSNGVGHSVSDRTRIKRPYVIQSYVHQRPNTMFETHI